MLYGIIADIHGNLEALDVVLRELRPADRLICAGDIVGYGPNPNECLQLIRGRNVQAIAGNHDKAAVGLMDTSRFNDSARRAIEWTGDQLTQANRKYLTDLPLLLESPDFQVVHGSLRSPLDEYIFGLQAASPTFEIMSKDLLFVGHTHVPLRLKEKGKEIINPGAVGQPRDGDPRASFGLYDSGKRSFIFRRVEYNVAAVQEKMRIAGLPASLIERLRAGV
ncbi:MAG: metallophosphoesterase family protein [Candidatus Margulisbacteria bacterium]|nr:metallophosphoesterase family protein [Candidatus Margulisiibacteriota bacterium]